MYTDNNLDKGKMLQVRQLRLVTSHPYLPLCRHNHIYIALHFFRKCFWAIFLNKAIPMHRGKDSGRSPVKFNRLTCQPKLAHDRSLCPFISGTQVQFRGEFFVVFLVLFFVFSRQNRLLSRKKVHTVHT